MKNKLALIGFILIATVTTYSQQPPAKADTARLLVQGTYEETSQGTTVNGAAQGKLLIKFETERWLKVGTDPAGDVEFSALNASPVRTISGSASYDGRVKGSGGDRYEATSSFAGPLGNEDVNLSVPEYSANGLKLKISIIPKIKGKCSLVEVRDGETLNASACENGTYFLTATSPVQIEENEDPTKTPATSLASFEIQLDVEPLVGQAAADPGAFAWLGAVTTGSKEAGFKIVLNKTRELPSDNKGGKSVRILNLTATITPGAPK